MSFLKLSVKVFKLFDRFDQRKKNVFYAVSEWYRFVAGKSKRDKMQSFFHSKTNTCIVFSSVLDAKG